MIFLLFLRFCVGLMGFFFNLIVSFVVFIKNLWLCYGVRVLVLYVFVGGGFCIVIVGFL